MNAIKRTLFSTLCIFLLWQVTEAQNLRLFHMERNKNDSIVCYDLEISDNLTINSKHSIDIYWETPEKGNARNGLSIIQNKFAYGLTVEKIEESSVVFKLKAFPQRSVTAIYDAENRLAYALTDINGKTMILKKLYVYATPPHYTSVEYIVLTGIDPETGETAEETIVNK